MNKIFNTKKLKKGILFLSLIALFSSCKKYLTETPTTNFSADFVYNTPEGLELGIVSLYNLQRNFYENGEWNFAIPQIIDAKTDITYGRAGEISLFSRLAWGSSLGDFGTTRYGHYWRSNYRVVDRANAIIKGAENVQGISEAQRNRILAEAKCFRARAFFTLYRLFNNIFVTTEPTTPENALDIIQNKSTEAEVFALVNSDLDFAIANLPLTNPEFGRFTKGAARHIRAQSAMWQKDWPQAKTQAEAIINSATYSLVPNCKDVFKNNLKHSETIFAVQYVPLIVGGGAPNRFSFLQLPQYGAIPGAQYALDFGGRGAGQLMLNPYLRNLLKADPNDTRDDNTYYVSYYLYNNLATLPPGKNIGDTIKTYNELGTSSDASNWRARLNPGCRKFSQEDGIPTEASQIANVMVYRLAETYLMAAEATWRISQNNADPVALGYLNAVRTRARCALATTINQQAILDEDARELAFESVRFYTLKRMGVMAQQMQLYAGYVNGPYSVNAQARTLFQPYMANWPIPVAEIQLLGPNYPQNTGY